MSLTTRTLPCGPDPVKTLQRIVEASHAVRCNATQPTRRQVKSIRYLSYSVGIAADDPQPCCKRHAGIALRYLVRAAEQRWRRLDREGWTGRYDELHQAHPDIYLDADSPFRIREVAP